jgi:ferric-dicitrate binding protein FerR (iron transport regulator)
MKQNYFLAKWLNDELSPEELAEFKAHPDYEIYENIRKYSRNLTLKDFDEDKILQKVLESKKQAKKQAGSVKWFYKIAAVLLLFIGITYFTVNTISTKTHITDNTSTETFLLPDSSKVVLNTNSKIKYKSINWKNNRNLTLKGTAYFHVSKGNKFVVSTDLGKVSVMGTRFEVKSQNNSFNVVCYEGKVKVNYRDKETILTKGMKVNFENGIQINALSKETNPYEQDSILVFKDEKLDTILSKLEKVYQVKIISKTTSAELFTGKLPSDNIDVALSIIVSTYKLDYKKTAESIVLFEKK